METIKDTISPLQRFWRLLKPDQKEIRNLYIYALFSGLVSLSLPLGIQAIVNLIQGGRISTSWIVLVVIVVLGVAITGILQVYQMRITENLQQKIFSRAAFEFTYRLPRIRLEALYKYYAPELMNRFFDTISLQKGLSKILIDFSAASLQVILGLMLLSFYHPFFIAFSLVLVLLIYAIFKLTARRGLKTSLEESKNKYEVAHFLEEVARTTVSFKLAGDTEYPIRQTDKRVEKYLHARESHFRILVQQYGFMIVFKVLVATGLLAIGSILVMEQLMNIGQFIAAEIIILLVMNSVEKLIQSFDTIYDVLTSLAKIGQVTDLELDNDTGSAFIDAESKEGLSVELNKVRFCYPGHKYHSLNDLSLNIKADERLVITGSNGAGKSTLIQILSGLYDTQKGQVIYNGLPKDNYEINNLRSTIGNSIIQESIFEGTIRDNITMERINATDENLKWAIKNLGLEEFIKNQTLGYDTIIESQGSKLPMSIVQKLLLARAIVNKPKLLVLENALDKVSKDERERIIDFLIDKKNHWTLIVLSTDTYLAQKVDQIIFLEDGNIKMKGTYNELEETLKAYKYA